MRLFTVMAAGVLTIGWLLGCGAQPGGRQPRGVDPPAESRPIPAPSSEAHFAGSTEEEPRRPDEEGSAPPGEAEHVGREDAPSPAASAKPDSPPIATEAELRRALREKNPEFDGQVGVRAEGRSIVIVELRDPAIEDISPLAGLPLQALDLAGCHVTDIGPLEGMPLAMLYLENTGVRDLSPLEGMPLVELRLNHTKVEDITPLRGAPLQRLYLAGTRVSDLRPLAGARLLDSLWLNDTPVSDVGPLQSAPGLVSLTLAGTKVSDLSPLKGLGLKRLHLARSQVTDLSPLKWLSLERLVFTPGKIEKGIDVARRMASIREIGTAFGEEAEGRQGDLVPPHVFWQRYDAGKLR